jgi:hypothetical protein
MPLRSEKAPAARFLVAIAEHEFAERGRRRAYYPNGQIDCCHGLSRAPEIQRRGLKTLLTFVHHAVLEDRQHAAASALQDCCITRRWCEPDRPPSAFRHEASLRTAELAANGWIRVVGVRRPHGDGQGDAPSAAKVRAAEYVRMSTDHQRYSTENQADAIRRYAESRGLEFVRSYADEGKSGLRLDGRDALKRLIDDVQSGNAG